MKDFTEFNLSEPIMRAITELGFKTPSPIQAETLPILLSDKPTDFLGLAATGTGKTAAFAIPLLQRIVASETARVPGVRAVILCPTRELAVQTAGQIGLIGKYAGLKALPIYGGTGYGDQIYGLKRGAQIVVGTPGRVVDHIEKGTLDLSNLETLILDEADEMISMGFKDDLEAVLQSVPEGQAQTWLFSATMSPDVRKVANTYLNEPEQVQVNRVEMVPESVEQIYYATQESNKPEVLCKLIEAADDFYGIVFCQTKSLVMDLHQYLLGRGYRVDCLHGDMEQPARDRTMRAFREKKVQILIATDVACRGLDVNDISHVINYSIPRELDNYVHRIGRTGRIGKAGLALSLVTNSHRGLIARIEKLTRSKMREGVIPTRKEIAAKKLAKNLSIFQAQAVPAKAMELLSDDWKKTFEAMSKEEIAGRFMSLLYPEVFVAREEAQMMRDSREGTRRNDRRDDRRGEVLQTRDRRDDRRPPRGDRYEGRPEDRGDSRRRDDRGPLEERSFDRAPNRFKDRPKRYGERRDDRRDEAPRPPREDRFNREERRDHGPEGGTAAPRRSGWGGSNKPTGKGGAPWGRR